MPARLRADLDRFEWDTPVVKVNWALDGPIPWRAEEVAGAGTVHLGADELGLVRWSADLESRTLPASPYMLFGQMTTADPSRSPAGTESAWAYTHLPRGIDDDASADELARRVDATVEAFAPGFGARVVHRHVQRPGDIEADGPEPRPGAVNGGTAQLFQQLVFRPVPGLGRPETVVGNLYLGGSSAHPGGGVHGICGALAARAALRDHGRAGLRPPPRPLRRPRPALPRLTGESVARRANADVCESASAANRIGGRTRREVADSATYDSRTLRLRAPGRTRLARRSAAAEEGGGSARGAPTAARPAAAAPSRPWWREAQSCGLRETAWSSKRPWAPWSRPSGPSAGSQRFAGASAGCGSSVCCESKPVRPR